MQRKISKRDKETSGVSWILLTESAPLLLNIQSHPSTWSFCSDNFLMEKFISIISAESCLNAHDFLCSIVLSDSYLCPQPRFLACLSLPFSFIIYYYCLFHVYPKALLGFPSKARPSAAARFGGGWCFKVAPSCKTHAASRHSLWGPFSEFTLKCKLLGHYVGGLKPLGSD